MSKFRVLVKGIVQYQDSYLAVERWYDDRIFDPYQWEFIDGEMEFGETPEKAVERIVAEKTGVAVQVNKPLYTNQAVVKDIEKAGLTSSFDLDDFGKVDLFIEPMD